MTSTITSDDWRCPAWHSDAKCAGASDPTLWDSNTTRRDPIGSILTAVALCDGCPVAAQCAREAWETNAQGVIRAGLAIPDSFGIRASKSLHRRACEDIMAGTPIPVAVARAIRPTDIRRRPAVGPLMAMKDARGYQVPGGLENHVGGPLREDRGGTRG